MSEAIERLLERLQTGWTPVASEIDRDIVQADALKWEWSHDGRSILSRSVDQRPQIHGDILYVSERLDFALTTEAMLWLIETRTTIPCVVCGRELDDESSGNNQPVAGLAFQCGGHWPSSVFDRGDGTFLEINVCEPCLRTATAQRRVLHGDREHRRARATYKIWDRAGPGDEIVGDDVWILQRDADESDEDYAERAAMLGCDSEGRLTIRRH